MLGGVGGDMRHCEQGQRAGGRRAVSPGLADSCSYRLPSPAADPFAILKGTLGAESGRLIRLPLWPGAALESLWEPPSLPAPGQNASSVRSPHAQAATLAEPQPQRKHAGTQAAPRPRDL